jgi:hypothetical protein
VASIGMLGDDNPRWRPDSYGYRRWGTEVGIRFPVVKLLDFADKREELERSPNPFATVVLAHLDTLETRQDQHERKNRKFRLIKGLYERGWDADKVRKLFRVIDWMMELSKDLDQELYEEIRRFEEENKMPYVPMPERIGMEKGRQQGMQQGIEAMLELRFGESGLRLMPEIRAIAETEKLEAILRAAKTAERPEDLRPIWGG